MKILVTGGCGFIGSNFIRYILKKHPRWEVTNVDKLTYAGNRTNLAELKHCQRYNFFQIDIIDKDSLKQVLNNGFDAIINFAAESHVDRSIMNASPFLDTNVKGVMVLLELVNEFSIPRFIQISTDEVYGSLDVGKCSEDSILSPSSPYSASKAAADLLCLSYVKTYKTPILITRCTNNFGPFQFPEKLIPLTIFNALQNKFIPVYGDGSNSRDWIYVMDHCEGIYTVLQRGRIGEIYNLGAGNERTNLQIVKSILQLLGKPSSLITFVGDRLGHDRRYCVNTQKITSELGWVPTFNFEQSLFNTVEWYKTHQTWLQESKFDM